MSVPTAPSYPNTGPVPFRRPVSNQTATGPNFTINAPPPPPAPTITGYTDLAGSSLSAATPGTSIKIVGSNFGARAR